MKKKTLPIKTEDGIITGFIPESWQVDNKIYPYQKCCANPENYVPNGNWRRLSCDGCDFFEKYYPRCPCFDKLYKEASGAVCKVCGTRIIATVYRGKR